MHIMQVAACVCLFSLDKHAAIPVDTHVWQLACRHYTPHLKGVLPHLRTSLHTLPELPTTRLCEPC